ncbi:MAG: NAD(P)-dependent oxidoreductase [Patescibacteria group bacterium]|jgi:dTDP-4-dehydrorhamnose reductase
MSTHSVRREKVLITGGTGLLGLSLIQNAPRNYDIFATYHRFPTKILPDFSNCKYISLDVTDKKNVMKLFKKNKPKYLIHTASIGSVDFCEQHKKEAFKINVLGGRNMIEACKKYDTKIIYTSSNAVFDGKNPPYKESDQTKPLDYYGKTKLQTEKDILKNNIKYCIVRLMTMYGWNHCNERPNPVTWLLDELKNNRQVKVVDDIYNNHLYVKDAAKAIWQIIKKNKSKIYHLAGPKTISRFDLSLNVAKTFKLNQNLIQPVDSSFFPSLAPRPKDTTYQINKMIKELGVKPMSPLKGLLDMKKNQPSWKKS